MLQSCDEVASPPRNKVQVMAVAITFVVLMIIALAWLVFYYVQVGDVPYSLITLTSAEPVGGGISSPYNSN